MRAVRWWAVAVLLCTIGFAAPGRAVGVAPVASVRPGQAAFWSSQQGGAFRIVVRPGGWRLRVAFDHPDFRRGVRATLADPSGREVAYLGGYDSGEAYVLHPVAGTWTLRVTSSDDSVLMRAKLERAPTPTRRVVPLLPNLRLIPPHEFTFLAPLSGGRFVYVGPAATGGSCTADDTAEQHGMRCLRFSLGPANVGIGPLELDFPGNQGLVTPGHATQTIRWSDGHTTTRPAGQFEYHKTHAHYHHSGFGKLELLKVGAGGALTHAGDGPKQGFCTADVKISEWSVFGGEQNSAATNCVDSAGLVYDPTRGTKMGLSPGWADLYSWEQDGNYVDFGLNTDGRYLVRSTADVLNNILESDETDNTSYAYIEVRGLAVKVLERGRGQSPWDAHKVVVHDGLHPNA